MGTLNDDGNQQIEEDEIANDDEEDEVYCCKRAWVASGRIPVGERCEVWGVRWEEWRA